VDRSGLVYARLSGDEWQREVVHSDDAEICDEQTTMIIGGREPRILFDGETRHLLMADRGELLRAREVGGDWVVEDAPVSFERDDWPAATVDGTGDLLFCAAVHLGVECAHRTTAGVWSLETVATSAGNTASAAMTTGPDGTAWLVYHDTWWETAGVWLARRAPGRSWEVELAFEGEASNLDIEVRDVSPYVAWVNRTRGTSASGGTIYDDYFVDVVTLSTTLGEDEGWVASEAAEEFDNWGYGPLALAVASKSLAAGRPTLVTLL